MPQSGRGLIAALNQGVAEAQGEYIARMDADDVALPERFARQLQFLRDHPAPTDDDIDANLTNLCRCATYARVRAAIHAAAGRRIG